MLKRVLATVVISTVALVSVAYAATQFSDVPTSHWAHQAIQWNNDSGIMTGPGDMPGMFDPAGSVNRAQLATTNQRLYDTLKADLNKMEDTIMDMDTKMNEMMGEGEAVEEMLYASDLMGDNQVPAVVTDAWGAAEMSLAGNTLTYSMDVFDLSGDVTAAHFHMAAAGENGDVAHTIAFDGFSADGTWELTTDDMTALTEGNLYINVHTDMNADGEIRGQVEEVI